MGDVGGELLDLLHGRFHPIARVIERLDQTAEFVIHVPLRNSLLEVMQSDPVGKIDNVADRPAPDTR